MCEIGKAAEMNICQTFGGKFFEWSEYSGNCNCKQHWCSADDLSQDDQDR